MLVFDVGELEFIFMTRAERIDTSQEFVFELRLIANPGYSNSSLSALYQYLVNSPFSLF